MKSKTKIEQQTMILHTDPPPHCLHQVLYSIRFPPGPVMQSFNPQDAESQNLHSTPEKLLSLKIYNYVNELRSYLINYPCCF